MATQHHTTDDARQAASNSHHEQVLMDALGKKVRCSAIIDHRAQSLCTDVHMQVYLESLRDRCRLAVSMVIAHRA